MAGEKTEPPTPKRLREARRKGQVFKSNDLVQAMMFLTAAGVISLGGNAYVRELREVMVGFFQPHVLRGDMAPDEILRRMGYAWSRMLILLAPLMGALMASAVAINFAQVNALFSFEVVKPKLDKLNPITGFKNVFFQARTYIELIKNIIKITVVLFLVWNTVKNSLRDVALSSRAGIWGTAQLAGDLASGLMYKVGVFFLMVGGADYLIQKKLYMKQMKMSKEEVQREYKEDEGDPLIKHMRKQIHEQMVHEGAIEHVPKADVVVVNPTHLAVAIRYHEATMGAPRITAKGAHDLAHRIVAIARQHHVPVLRQIALARSLYQLEVGKEIPEDLYEAVAEVLNFVYQLAHEEAPEE